MHGYNHPLATAIQYLWENAIFKKGQLYNFIYGLVWRWKFRVSICTLKATRSPVRLVKEKVTGRDLCCFSQIVNFSCFKDTFSRSHWDWDFIELKLPEKFWEINSVPFRFEVMLWILKWQTAPGLQSRGPVVLSQHIRFYLLSHVLSQHWACVGIDNTQYSACLLLNWFSGGEKASTLMRMFHFSLSCTQSPCFGVQSSFCDRSLVTMTAGIMVAETTQASHRQSSSLTLNAGPSRDFLQAFTSWAAAAQNVINEQALIPLLTTLYSNLVCPCLLLHASHKCTLDRPDCPLKICHMPIG